VAAQFSTITADVNSVATLFTSDVYRTLKRVEPTQRQLLQVVRFSSLACGLLMLTVAWGLKFISAGAVNINLAVVGILDMPLFVITILYGLTWRRINWQGAAAGFLLGGIAGILCYYRFEPALARKMAPIVSTGTALIVTPLVALLTPPSRTTQSDQIFHDFGKGQTGEGDAEPFDLIPRSRIGKLAAIIVLAGFLLFAAGIFTSACSLPHAGPLAVTGLLSVLTGGLVRVYSD